MNREVHVRFWEGVGVKLSRATQLSYPLATKGWLVVSFDDEALMRMLVIKGFAAPVP